MHLFRRFRFQTGSIKSYSPVLISFQDNRFDSKLVRLKEILGWQSRHRRVLFRFQTGSIKSIRWCRDET